MDFLKLQANDLEMKFNLPEPGREPSLEVHGESSRNTVVQ